MKKNRSTTSKGKSYKEIADFWDTHDLADYWDSTRAVKFEVDIQTEKIYYPVETALSNKLRSIARKRGVSAETLLNLWVQEKVGQLTAK